ncbi:MAG: hypothetical protein AB7U30_00015 [Sulfuricellaceae bacterium]
MTGQPAISKRDFNEALIDNRLTVSEVAKQTGINRATLSHFRNYGDGLKPEQMGKLVDYLNSIGVHPGEGEEDENATGITIVDPLGDREQLRRSVYLLRHFAIDPGLTMEQINAAMDRMDANEVEIREILDKKAERGFLSDDWNGDTQAHLFDLMGKLAENFTIFRHLQGRPLVSLEEKVESDDVRNIGDLLNSLLHDSISDLAETLTVQAEATDDQPEEEVIE